MEGALFTPPDGRKRYQSGDLCEQQLILLHDIPNYLVDPSNNPAYIKPKLWLGWYLNEDALFTIISKHFPNDIIRDTSGLPNMGIPELLKSRLQISSDFAYLVDIVEAGLPDTEGKINWVISVGNNRKGYICQEYLDGIQAIMGGGEDPK